MLTAWGYDQCTVFVAGKTNGRKSVQTLPMTVVLGELLFVISTEPVYLSI
jgi:hypothetical protein